MWWPGSTPRDDAGPAGGVPGPSPEPAGEAPGAAPRPVGGAPGAASGGSATGAPDGRGAARTAAARSEPEAPAEAKARWRQRLRQEWRRLDAGWLAAASRAICDRVAALPVWEGARALMLYAPLPGEVDVTPLWDWGRQRGLTVLLPWLDPAAGRMEARVVKDRSDTAPGPYGLRVPRDDCPAWSPDARTVVIVPGLAFDREGWRLGRGGGYYDRFLAKWPGAWRVGVVPARFLLASVPRAGHDRRMDWLVTDEGACGPWWGLR